ncbi:uncharacterized protein LOC112575061 [Pomacea canaliculata]|uniref:uncharacterized protein LOC112575061 n=1 Tax=Pomacea canaliculata TaxID=400727 RepID=UPI000D7314B7|nr:uncharacterized protein LOC112575061 [Pomacea canaliculata]
MLFCLMNLLSLASCSNMDETVVDTSLLRQTVPPQSLLQCLQCTHEAPGCYSLTSLNSLNSPSNTSLMHVAACALNQPHCMVRRVETAGVMTSFERRCAAHCMPGCSVAHNQLTCTSCCNGSLCNVDNTATTCRASARHILIVITTAATAAMTLHPGR